MDAMRFVWFLALASGLYAQSPFDDVDFVEVATGLDAPVQVTHAGDGSGRLFIVERSGRILIHDGDQVLAEPLLAIGGRVRSGGGNSERGLLSVAFHPRYRENGFFFVNYTALDGATIVSRFESTADRNRANPDSEAVFLRVEQPFGNHNGGQLHFGPDGFLYVGMGDGGSGGDPGNRAQNRQNLLGKMLRLDVDQGAPARPAPGNPFENTDETLDEIWALGLRNPWRFSFDRETGDLWIGDVGQGNVEEISFQPAESPGGENYGWRLMEGSDCFNPGSNCNDGTLTLPRYEYRQESGRCSVTGGYVYRGALPQFYGLYFFGDFCTGEIWARGGTENPFFERSLGPLDTPWAISSFGEDESGELYVVDLGGGVYRLTAPRALPLITDGGIVNAASFRGADGLALGTIVSVFGSDLAGGNAVARRTPLPQTLAGLRLRLGDQALPLFFAGPGQANAQLPWSGAPSGSARLTADLSPFGTVTTSFEVSSASPGIFTLDQSGSGQGAILIAGAGTVAAPGGAFVVGARPARLGETIEVFVTGLGPVEESPQLGSPNPVDRLIRTTNGVTARIGVEPVRVTFAGLAPGFVGLYQVNIELVGDLPSGQAELTIFVDGTESNTVTLTIE